MKQKTFGQRMRAIREAKGLTQEKLAEMVNLSPTHISVIERGIKTPNLDSFVAIANALEVSADTLLIDVVDHAVEGIADDLSRRIARLPHSEQTKILKVLEILLEEEPYRQN